MTKRILRYSGLGLAVFAAGAIVACSSSDEAPGTPTAGASAGGAKTGGAGGASAGTPSVGGGGTAGAGTAGAGGGSAGFACVGTKPGALITEFADLVPHPTMIGDYSFTLGVPGGTYTYAPMKLTLSNTGMMLNAKGTVDNYYGVGIYFNTCTDASAYTGVSFSIKGDAGPTGKIGFRVQTNSNMPVNASAMKGTCVVPAGTTNTYPLCHDGEVEIPVTAAGAVVSINFSQIMGGIPVSGVTAKELVGLEWAFRYTPPVAGTAGAGGASGGSGGAAGTGTGGGSGSGGAATGGSGGSAGGSAGSGGSGGSAGSATGGTGGGGSSTPSNYAADITIDNIMFIGGPPAGGAGGAGGGSAAGAGGASAGSGGASAGSGGASAGSGGASAGSGGKAGSGG